MGTRLGILADSVIRLITRFIHRRICRREKSASCFLLYPEISHERDLNNYVSRLDWYLRTPRGGPRPRVLIISNKLSEENLRCSDDIAPRARDYEIQFVKSVADIPACRVTKILLWDSHCRNQLGSNRRLSAKLRGAGLENIDSLDHQGQEYGVLASLTWRLLYSGRQRQELLSDSRRKFELLAETIGTDKPFSLVLGTGPSFSKHKFIDAERGVVIACNSAVENRGFFEKMEPDFLVFGDGAHHAGPSLKAQRFRDKLKERMEEFSNFKVVTTAKFAPLFLEDFSEFTSRFFFFEQSTKREPNFRLDRNFAFPALDSVTTIYMLPIAAYFSNRIYLLGLDGISQTGDNEDFWAHDESMDYKNELDGFHRVHPTFAYHRRVRLRDLKPTHERYELGLQQTLQLGETVYGKSFVSLSESHSRAVSERYDATLSNNVTAKGSQEPLRLIGLK